MDLKCAKLDVITPSHGGLGVLLEMMGGRLLISIGLRFEQRPGWLSLCSRDTSGS